MYYNEYSYCTLVHIERTDFLNALSSTLTVFVGAIGIFIIFLVCARSIKKGVHSRNRQWDLFWNQEREAAFTTKSHFPTPLLLTIERDKIPYIEKENYQLAYERLLKYENHKMVYLKELSNLEIKKQYGINFFNDLITYEEIFYGFMNELVQYAALLREGHDLLESIQILEYSLSFGYKSAKISKELLELQKEISAAPLSMNIKADLKTRIQNMLN